MSLPRDAALCLAEQCQVMDRHGYAQRGRRQGDLAGPAFWLMLLGTVSFPFY